MNLKNIFNIAAVAAISAFGLSSCSADDLDLYEGGKDSVFIQQIGSTTIDGKILSYRGNSSFSFAGAKDPNAKQRSYFFVRLSGNISKVDRKYVLNIVSDSTTCSDANVSLEGNDFIIKAGCAMDTVFVTFTRTADLRNKTVRAFFRLEPNENFNVGYKDGLKNTPTWSATGKILPADSYYYTFGEIYNEPRYWGYYGDTYWGKFTPEKYLALNDCMGWTQTDWSNSGTAGSGVNLGRLPFSAVKFKQYLQKFADEGNPVREADGSLMQLPSPYTVNYSAYEN